MPNTLHVDYELMTHDESMKIIEEAMKNGILLEVLGALALLEQEKDKK